MIKIAKRAKRKSTSKSKKTTKKSAKKSTKRITKKVSNSRPKVGKTRLQPLHFGLAVGIAMGLGCFLLGLAAMYYSWGVALVNVLSSLYTYFAPTPQGSIYGLVWGFIDGFIGGYIVAWLYNWMEHVK